MSEFTQLTRAEPGPRLLPRPLDNTALEAYMSCPRKFYYSMVKHRRGRGGQSPALAYGTTWHAMMEAHYKAQPVDCKVLTPTGWREIGALSEGDWIIGATGKPIQVLGIYPQGDIQAFDVTFSDGGKTRCSGNHWWLVKEQTNLRKGWQMRTADDIRANTWSDGKTYRRFQVPLPAPVEFHQATVLPVHPFILGCLLGDGYIGGDMVTMTLSEEELIDKMRLFLPTGVSLRNVASDNLSWTIKGSSKTGGNPVLNGLRTLRLLGTTSATKFIPAEYFLASISDRQALLTGLLDTDAHTRDGTIIYTTVSAQLAAGVVELVQSLGGIARITAQKTVAVDRQQPYLVSIRLPDFVPFQLKRKADAYKQERDSKNQVLSRYITAITPIPGVCPQVCIKVDAPDGLYITENYIVTHNTGGDIKAVTDAAVASWQPHDNPEDHRTLQRAVSEYGQFLSKYGDHDTETRLNGITVGFPTEPLVECPTEVWWPGALHPYTGKIDRIFEHHGLYYVEDHKTTSAMGATYFRQFDPSNQMMGYAWLAQKLSGLPIAGVRINAHAVLKGSSKFERQTIMFSEERLEEWSRNLNAWIRRMAASYKLIEDTKSQEHPEGDEDAVLDAATLAAFPHNFQACAGKYGQCTYTDVCTYPARMRDRILESEFTEHPWNPLNPDGDD